MPEGESLPKGGSAEWLKAADKKDKEFRDYHSERWFGIGPVKKRPMLAPGSLSRAISDKALMLRNKGMELKRKESQGMSSLRGKKGTTRNA